MPALDLLIEKGSHLRRVHFYIVVASFLVIALRVGFQELVPEEAIDELEMLRQSARALKSPPSDPYFQVQSKWNNLELQADSGPGLVIKENSARKYVCVLNSRPPRNCRAFTLPYSAGPTGNNTPIVSRESGSY
jgi:hypothetical protein